MASRRTVYFRTDLDKWILKKTDVNTSFSRAVDIELRKVMEKEKEQDVN